MADRCLCHAYFEGVYDKQIKQGQDFDLAQGVRAIDGYGNEVDFTYEPTEIDLCKTGDQEVTYKAFGASFNVIPKLCMPKYKKGVSIPEACPSDLEMITAKRIIRIIRASNPRFLGIPRVTIAQNTAFDPTEGVTAVDDNGNTIDFSYEGKYDLVTEGDDITTFETEYAQNAKAVEVALEPIQDGTPWMGTDEYTNPYLMQAMPTISEDYNTEMLESIVGGTVAWNQLVSYGDFSSTSGWLVGNLVDSISASNNVLTATIAGGTTNNSWRYGVFRNISIPTGASDHYYLCTWDVKPSIATSMRFEFGGSAKKTSQTLSANQWTTVAFIDKKASFNAQVYAYPQSAVESVEAPAMTVQYRNVMCFDLTQMFGSTIADYIYSLEQANAGAGVAWFKKLFPNDYYPYNAGELISVSGLQSHDTVGFNVFDKNTMIIDDYYVSDGSGAAVSSSGSKCTDFIPVVGGQSYYIKSDQTTGMCGAWYDADKNFISGIAGYNSYSPKIAPINARYARFTIVRNNDGNPDTFCINLSWSGWRNGEYEPYQKHSYPLDSSLTLRGIPKLDAQNNLYYDGDEYKADGTVARKYGVVDMGTLAWQYITTNDRNYFRSYTNPARQSNSAMLCSKYTYGGVTYDSAMTNASNGIYSPNASQYLYVKDTAYTDAASFKTAMSGVYLAYELATPTTESADPYTLSQTVYDGGTEEFVGAEIPVGHQSRYALVCPISGHTEVVTQRTGKNLCEVFIDGYVPSINNGELASAVGARSNFVPILPNTRYTFSANSSVTMYTFYYDKNKHFLTYQNGTSVVSYDSPSNSAFAMLRVSGSSISGINFQFERGERTTYEPYQGTTYTTALGQTVYGGTVNLVNGELTIDRVTKTLNGTENWSYNATTGNLLNITTPLSDVVNLADNSDTEVRIVADKMKGVSSATATSSGTRASGNIAIISGKRVYASISTDIATNSTEFTNWVSNNPITIVYELATPQTIQLSPQQVELLKGTNNVWSEEGDVRVIYEGNIPQDGSFEYPLEGEYTITYKATDKCGNEGTAERTIVVTPSE